MIHDFVNAELRDAKAMGTPSTGLSTSPFGGLARAGSNRDALTAAENALIGKVSRLFVHGSEGTGKTSLLNALLGELWRSGSGMTVRMYRAEQWLLQRQKPEGVDVLLVDDLQIILRDPGATVSLNEAVSLVLAHGGQVIACSLLLPTQAECQKAGLGGSGWRRIGLYRPGYEDRLELLRQMASLAGVCFSDSTYGLVAERVRGALRGLRGALNRLIALQENFGPAAVTPARVVGLLGPLETSGAHAELPEAVWMVVARRYHWRDEEARDACCYLLCAVGGVTENVAADWLGVSRSTVHRGIASIRAGCEKSPSFTSEIEQLAKDLDAELLIGHERRGNDPSLSFPALSGAFRHKG